MNTKKWSEIKGMNKEELQQEFVDVAKKVERLSKQVYITTDEEDVFDDNLSYCIEALQRLRNRTCSLYYDKILNK